MRALAAVGALVVGVLIASTARADTPPSAWDRVKDPSAAESYRLHVEVQRRLASAARTRADIEEAQARTSRVLLERYNAAQSKDPRLRFDLGMIYEQLKEYDKAAKILAATLAEHPDHPAAESAWGLLASACGHIGDRDCERKAYNEQLKHATEDIERGTPTLNLAETEMHSGNLREAIEGYREALRIAGRYPSLRLAPLAVWGLAVALDRSGDRLGAEKEARFARELERSMGMQGLLRDTHSVFFYPSYELHWYEGLGASAAARQATTPNEILRLWRSSEQSYASYIRFAEIAAQKDRWLELARIRHEAAKAERIKAEKKYGKEPPRELEDDERELQRSP
jgi:tetratricopeptide (TPR) repeat protein